MVSKVCKTCLQTKPVSGFYKYKNRNVYHPYCKECCKKMRHEIYKIKKDEILARCKRYYKKNATIIREKQLTSKFGISIELYNKTLKKQSFCCAICGDDSSQKRMCVDHCHKSGEVRGILCTNCNVLLGLAGDSIELFEKAISYLLSRQQDRYSQFKGGHHG